MIGFDVQSNTPEASPVSIEHSSGSGSNGTRKRVDFSSWTDDGQPPKHHPSYNVNDALRPLPPSRDCKSTKSILKNNATTAEPSVTEIPHPSNPRGMVAMLDSILLQLEPANRSISIDAYANLCGTLKAYKDTPSSHALKSKIGTLLNYIRRDIQSKASETSLADTSLVTQSLKILVFIIWNSSLALLLPDEYRIFIIEEALQAVEDPTTPKAILLHYLHLLATQDFRANIMTTGRVVRLLSYLEKVTNNVKGNGIVCERLMVYSRLLDQAKSVMKAKTVWIEHLLAGLLLPSRDARTKAIALGMKAAQVLGSSSTFSSACQQVLDRETKDKTTLSSLACKRLRNMVKSNEYAAQAPQIWAVVMLLQKESKTKVEKWSHFKEWLMAIQTCFNCSDSTTRAQANLAWNRLIYVVALQESTDSAIIRMLIKPIVSQLERPGNDKERKGSRIYATSSLCTLLYYALRPSGSPASYDLFWDAFVSKTFSVQFLANLSNADNACRIIMAICYCPKSKIWRENRANEAGVVEPEELPVLDCKWLRSRSMKVMPVFRKLFRYASWGPGKPDQAFVGMAWKHFCLAMGDACRKEVKPSPDLLHCISSFLDLLQTLQADWLGTLNDSNDLDLDALSNRLHFIIKCMIAEIGPIPFTEDLFCSSGSGPFAPVHSLAQESERETISAAEIILRMVCHLPNRPETFRTHETVIKNILHDFTEQRSSLDSLLRFYRICAVRTTARVPEDGSIGPKLIWKSSADLMEEALTSQQSDKLRGHNMTIDFRHSDVLGVLLAGLNGEVDVFPSWRNLLARLLLVVEQVNGPMSILCLVLEPLSSTLVCMSTDMALKCSDGLLEVSLTQKRWSTIASIYETTASTRSQKGNGLVRSFQTLLSLANKQLAIGYSMNDLNGTAELEGTVNACMQLLNLTPLGILKDNISLFTGSLSLWLEDQAKMFISTTDIGCIKSRIVQKLCSSTLNLIRRLGKDDTAPEYMEKLLVAGLVSTHQVVINGTIAVLRETFDDSSEPRYSSTLRTTLASLSNEADLGLPLFHMASQAALHQSERVLDSQEDGLLTDSSERFKALPPSHIPISSRRPKNLMPPSSPVKSSFQNLALVKGRPLPKLRHDDSQIQYAIIESSPAPSESEYQTLTENQICVRERQKAEPATTFSDLISSPALGTDKTPSKKPVSKVSTNVIEKATFALAVPSTPTLPEQQSDDLDEGMPSSPTPSSKSQVLRLSEIELPSSPPTGHETAPASAANQYRVERDREAQDGQTSVNEEMSELSTPNTASKQKISREISMNRNNPVSSPIEVPSSSSIKDISLLEEVHETVPTTFPASCHAPDTLYDGMGDLDTHGQEQDESGPESSISKTTDTFHSAPTANLNDACPLQNKDNETNRCPRPLNDESIHGALTTRLVELEEVRLDSDDADLLSASQLEYELNSSAVDETHQEFSGQVQLSVNANQEFSGELFDHREEQDSQAHHTPLSSPKGKSSHSVPLHRSANPQKLSESKTESEMLDCIMVDTEGQHSQTSVIPSNSFTATQATSRRKGRPGRKRKSPDRAHSNDDIEVQISPRKRTKISPRSEKLEVTLNGKTPTESEAQSRNELDRGVSQYAGRDEAKNASRLPTTSTPIITNQEPELRGSNGSKELQGTEQDVLEDAGLLRGARTPITSSKTETAVLTDLQNALTSLRCGSISMGGLRNIEDVLFRIRVMAQNNVING